MDARVAARSSSTGVKPKVPPLIIIILDGAMSRIDDEAEFSSRASEARLTYNKVHKCARVREREKDAQNTLATSGPSARNGLSLSLSVLLKAEPKRSHTCACAREEGL